MAQRDDPRFDSMHSAPIFKKSKKDKFKVKIDDRFKEVLTDDRFRLADPRSVDKYGRKIKSKVTAADELKEFYQIDQDQQNEVSREKHTPDGSKKTSLTDAESRLDYLNKLARGEISGSSSDDDDNEIEVDESSESEGDNDFDESGVNDPLAVPGDIVEESADVESNRLAIQNCDWENLTAEDIMVILQSFCPLGGTVKSVTVYPSDYGLSCMKEEAIHGPPKFIWKSNPSSTENYDRDEKESLSDSEESEESDDDINLMDINDLPEDDEGEGDFTRPEGSKPGLVFQHDEESSKIKQQSQSDIDAVALRTYELSKLRYYFAIAVVNSSATADHLYREVDGLELEHSSMALDLRIVPDDVSFKGRQVRDHCDKVSVDYVPPTDFVMNAKQHTDVKCTWEAGDDLGGGIENARDRIMARRRAKETTASKWRDLQESDMLQYMASSGSESDESDSDNDLQSKKSKSQKAAMMRKMLLGEDGGEEDDDFFVHDDAEQLNDTEDLDDVHKVMTFVPQDEDSVDEDTETPAEAAKRKRLQKKLKKKELKEQESIESSNISRKKKGKLADEQAYAEENENGSTQQLELLFAGEENEAVDRLKFSKKEFEKVQKYKDGSKKQKKRKRGNDIEEDNQFQLDLHDDRFTAVLEGTNPHFGIDPLANEFRATDGMNQLLNEQHKRREQKVKLEEKSTKSIDTPTSESSPVEIDHLVKKLKSKSSKESIRKPLRH